MMAARVLHVVPAIAARYGGPSVAALGMARALGDAGMHVLLATTDADGPGRLDVPIARETTIDGVPAIVFARQGSERFKWSAALGRWLRRHVADFGVVHVHAVFSYSTLAAGRACRASGVPYLVRPLGTLDPWSLSRHARRKRALLGLGLRRVLHDAAAMHYTTAEERRLAEGAVPELPRGVVVPLGLDETWFVTPPPDDRDRQIVILARLDPKKGIETAIRAFHLASDGRLASYGLTIAGAGDPGYEGELQRLAAKGPAASRIRFTGWLGGTDRMAFLSRAALFLMPSRQENFGLGALEAMARGTPVIVAPGVNLAPDLARAGAGWVIEAEPDALAAGIVAAVADPTGLRRRGAAARRFAEAFRWPAVAAALRSLYDELAEKR